MTVRHSLVWRERKWDWKPTVSFEDHMKGGPIPLPFLDSKMMPIHVGLTKGVLSRRLAESQSESAIFCTITSVSNNKTRGSHIPATQAAATVLETIQI